MSTQGHNDQNREIQVREKELAITDFVLEKSIFSNIFEKDIRRVFIYKKAERLAKALHLIAPAFALSATLRNRLDAIAIGLVDAAVLPPASARDALSRELLALSSVLAIARTGGLLSSMNADLIARESHLLLAEVASYEEPRLFFDAAPSLAGIAKEVGRGEKVSKHEAPKAKGKLAQTAKVSKGHSPVLKDIVRTDRTEAIVSVIRSKGRVYIKDISTVVRGVSEKTIQRELQSLLAAGIVRKEGERRWTSYFLV